jgi:hypothetical protein
LRTSKDLAAVSKIPDLTFIVPSTQPSGIISCHNEKATSGFSGRLVFEKVINNWFTF